MIDIEAFTFEAYWRRMRNYYWFTPDERRALMTGHTSLQELEEILEERRRNEKRQLYPVDQ